jgi:hypothetical protein
MKNQTQKSFIISGLEISETAEGNTVALSINDQATILTRADFIKLHEAGNELFAKQIVLKCGACGHEMAGSQELSENTATLTIEPCQACARKEPENL